MSSFAGSAVYSFVSGKVVSPILRCIGCKFAVAQGNSLWFSMSSVSCRRNMNRGDTIKSYQLFLCECVILLLPSKFVKAGALYSMFVSPMSRVKYK